MSNFTGLSVWDMMFLKNCIKPVISLIYLIYSIFEAKYLLCKWRVTRVSHMYCSCMYYVQLCAQTMPSPLRNITFTFSFYAFSRRFYPKRLTIAFRLYIFISMCVPWESNPQPFALLTQCSTTEPHRNTWHTCGKRVENIKATWT